MTRTTLATLLCLLPALARADFTARDSTGETITFDSTETSSVHTTHHVITDGAGTRQGTQAAPIYVDGSLECTDGGNSITVDASSWPLPTGAATSANQSTANTSLASILSELQDVVVALESTLAVSGTVTAVGAAATGAAVSGNPVLVAGQTIGGDVQPLNVDLSGYLQTVGIGGAGTPNGGIMSVQGVSGGEELPVSVSSIAAGTANIGDVDVATIAAGDNNIGNVDLASSIPAGSNNIGDVDVASVAAPSSIYHGQTTVTTAGTEVTLGSSQALTQGCWVKALAANTGFIYVGANPVTSSTGYQLDALESIFVPIANRTTIYIDSSVNGEGAAYICN